MLAFKPGSKLHIIYKQMGKTATFFYMSEKVYVKGILILRGNKVQGYFINRVRYIYGANIYSAQNEKL